jgi:hypothetical protein
MSLQPHNIIRELDLLKIHYLFMSVLSFLSPLFSYIMKGSGRGQQQQ